ncbi:transporter substrate-binding domain-containing protein [Legionella impletisoli]|nr:transporter substrate-binding domain-containing protein [Legionella impletisoli]
MNYLLSACLLLCLSISCYGKPLLIGTSQLNPPFEMMATKPDHFYGFDIDMMLEICRRMNQECVFKTVMFNEIFPEIDQGTLDLAIWSIIITSEREKNYSFSMPYLQSEVRFITLKDSPIDTPNDIAGKTVGIRFGSPFGDVAKDIYQNDIIIKQYPLVSDLIEGLNQKEIDAAILDNEAAEYWAANNDELYKLIGSKLPVGKGYGILAKLGQNELISEINKALLSMEEDGKYLEIYNRYFD